MVIAVVGIYGVMAYVVSQRTQEIGIRMALGAPPSAVLASVLGGALVQVVVGLAPPAGAWGLAGVIGAFLFEVRPHDPGVYVGAVPVLALAGLTRYTRSNDSPGDARTYDDSPKC